MAYGYTLEAEYSDGYIHNEDDHEDVSPYTGKHNVFNDILEKRPEAEHGRMVRFSIIGNGEQRDINWRELPDNARPIYYRDMQLVRDMGAGTDTVSATAHHFGYQYNDENGTNHQEIQEL